MKRLGQQILTSTQKEKIALHTQELFQTLFETSIKDKEQLLERQVQFLTLESINEKILNQTVVKVLLPRISYNKQQMISKLPKAEKLTYSNPKEKSDIRFVVEVETARKFAEAQNSIVNINMNSEKPDATTVTMSSGRNIFNDMTVCINNGVQVLLDKKSGNNASKPFGGILGEIPLVTQNQPYVAINEPLFLEEIQQKRRAYFQLSGEISEKSREMYEYITHLDVMPLDAIKKNILIQEKIFKILSETNLSQRPSFYFVSLMKAPPELHDSFFKKLDPHINAHIFDDLKTAQQFMATAINIYDKTVSEVVNNINKSKLGWEGTGFEQIQLDIFK